MNVLRWLYKHRTEGCSVAAVEGATQYSHWELVEWLHQAYPGQFVTELWSGGTCIHLASIHIHIAWRSFNLCFAIDLVWLLPSRITCKLFQSHTTCLISS